jgi:hypothetical protein
MQRLMNLHAVQVTIHPDWALASLVLSAFATMRAPFLMTPEDS